MRRRTFRRGRAGKRRFKSRRRGGFKKSRNKRIRIGFRL